MLYELAARRYFRETGRTLHAGDTVELDPAVAAEINRNEGPVLRPARLTTQGRAKVVRSRSSGRKATAPRRRAGR